MENDRFEQFLRELVPYVVVVGSFGRNEEGPDSDIDCYLRRRPLSMVDPEKQDETYMPEVRELVKKYGYGTSSVVIGHIAVEEQPGVPRMVEIASHYRIPKDSPVFTREIYGVKFLCARDNKDTQPEDLYENVDWDDTVGDMVMKNPLPDYPA